MSEVLVLNASFEPWQKVSLQHAILMLHRKVAVIEEAIEGVSVGQFPRPKVLRLVRYVFAKWNHGAPLFSLKRVLRRDNHVCGYCLGQADTVDHVKPRSKGGESTWLNTVAACARCNHAKGNRTLASSGMDLLIEPFEPTWWQVSVRH